MTTKSGATRRSPARRAPSRPKTGAAKATPRANPARIKQLEKDLGIGKDGADSIGARSYATIEPLEPQWLWPGRIPLNEVTIVAGDGGIGKGFLMADLTSRVTRGAPMPDGTMPDVGKGSVVMVTIEDDPNMAMVYRLTAAGAELAKVYDRTGDDFVIPDSLPGLREDIDKIGDVRAAILDPLSAVSSIPITSGNVRIRRRLMMPMERFAKDTGTSLIAVHHTVKSGRTAGAKAITDTARMVLRVYRSAVDDRIRVVSVNPAVGGKCNIASDAWPDVAYTVAGEWPNVGVRWLALPDTSGDAQELSTADKIVALLSLKPVKDEPEEVTDARKRVADLRGPDGSLEAQVIARELHVAYGTVRVALSRAKADRLVEQGRNADGTPRRGTWRKREPREQGDLGELVELADRQVKDK